MRDIDITELTSSLPTYLALATAGETILIRDHETPVAQLIPAAEANNKPPLPLLPLTRNDFTEEELALAADGVMTLPNTAWTGTSFGRCRSARSTTTRSPRLFSMNGKKAAE